MSEYGDDVDYGSGKKKYVILGAVGIVAVAVVAVLFSGMLEVEINDEPIGTPDALEGGTSVFTDLDEIMEGLDVPEQAETAPEEGGDTGVVPIEDAITEDVTDGDVQNLTELAVDLLIDAREEYGLAENDEPDESGLTMEDILGPDPPDPEEVSEPGADILEKVEEFKSIPSEPVPDGATSGTVTWVVTGNIININEVLIHLTGVPAGGVSERDDLMRECPRDTLVLYVLTSRTDSDGNAYGKVWCYGYPPAKPETTVNNILG